MHNRFDFKSEYGQKVVKETGAPKDYDDDWTQMLHNDLFLIENCDIFLYDIDSNPGFYYVTPAIIFNKPIWGVSKTLAGIPALFSGYFKGIIKPSDIIKTLNNN